MPTLAQTRVEYMLYHQPNWVVVYGPWDHLIAQDLHYVTYVECKTTP